MKGLFGSYECRIDAKGRMMLPAPLKKTLEPVIGQGFVLKKSPYHPCLEIYPSSEWEVIMNRVKDLNMFMKDTLDFLRKYTAGYKLIELDGIGRLQIPKDLVVFAGIKKDVVVAGYIHMVEIWDKAKYEKALSDATIDNAMLAEKIFGPVNKGNS